jgi:DNA polymerase-3 subunit alpha
MNLPQVEEWDDAIKLAHEKEALGLFISSDPIGKYAHLMPFLAPIRFSDFVGLEDGVRIALAGMVTDPQERISKSGRNAGKKLVLFKIRTLEGNVPAVAFVKEYEQYKSHLEEDRFRIFKGMVDRKRNGPVPALKIVSVATVDEVLQAKAVLILRAGSPDKLNEQFIEKIRDVVTTSPGATDLILYFEAPDRKPYTVKAGPRFKVTPTEKLIAQLQEVVGPGNVELR